MSESEFAFTLKKQLQAIKNQSYEELISAKRSSVQYAHLHDKAHYESLIYNPLQENLDTLQPGIECVETEEQDDLFTWFLTNTSSVPLSTTTGRALKILVKDQSTMRYIGLLAFTSCVFDVAPYLGVSKVTATQLNTIRKSVVNMSCCVPLQPFGKICRGGKLLALIAFSQEVMDAYKCKFGIPVAMILTLSIHGKSIQYDRLKELRLMGYTYGQSAIHISDSLVEDSRHFLQSRDVDTRNLSKINIMKRTLELLHLPHDTLTHGKKRGIYVGFTSSNSTPFLLGRESSLVFDKLRSVSDAHSFWQSRWMKAKENAATPGAVADKDEKQENSLLTSA